MNFWVYLQARNRHGARPARQEFAVTRIGSGDHLGATGDAPQGRPEPDRDVALRQIGGTAEVYGALVAGAVDAAMLAIPTTSRPRTTASA